MSTEKFLFSNRLTGHDLHAYRVRVATFGENLRRIREAANVTQEELARRLKLKRTTPISLWENLGTLPRPKTIVRVAGALECSPADLLEGVVTPYDLLRTDTQAGVTPRPKEPPHLPQHSARRKSAS